MDLKNRLNMMKDERGSDLFLTAGRPPSMKVDGSIRTVGPESLTLEQTMTAAQERMTSKQFAEFEASSGCQFAVNARGAGRFRISAFKQRNQAGLVLRRIETRIPTIAKLRLPSILRELGMQTRGIVIFVGGTGTGKSTSLAALIGYRNRMSRGHIITIEDPIEYIHEHDGCIITQREVGVDTASFEVALRNTLRLAPDVILIGAIRTRETMEYALPFAETGHLVFATLHATNACQALDRIVNFFPDEVQRQLYMDLSLNLRAIVAQQLLPHKSGRPVVVELLLNTPLVATLIRKSAVHKLRGVMANSNELGMITLDQALFQLLEAGQIGYEEARKHADSANSLRLMVKLNGSKDPARRLAEAADKISLVDDSPDEDSSLIDDTAEAPPSEITQPDTDQNPPKQPSQDSKLKLSAQSGARRTQHSPWERHPCRDDPPTTVRPRSARDKTPARSAQGHC